MPRITAGNHLYFYQLFCTEMGVGKQTPLARVEEILSEADVLLEDVECASIEELLSFPEDSESHWWIADMAMGALQKVIRKNGTVYKSGYNSRNSKSGVRPVIEIHADDLKKLKNN